MTGRTVVHIGCAGWSVPKLNSVVANSEQPDITPRSHLERYADSFNAVEINSSFYRPHKPATYTRWRETVPADFRFSVKIPKIITHQLRLQNCDSELERFIFEVGHLAKKLGVLLIQIPPSLRFDADIAQKFFARFTELTAVPLALEARHVSWFNSTAYELLQHLQVALVQADPSPAGFAAAGVNTAELPRTASTHYVRLHGSPVVYSSSYDLHYLNNLAERIRLAKNAGPVWCVFDNTARGAAFENAAILRANLKA